MMLKRLIVLLFVSMLVACASPTLFPAATATPGETIEPGALSAAVEYNLGETTIVQYNFLSA
jgi:hypothetical protein